ncbi:MAG: hypothetical protein JO281_08625 [Pseudonocardiales bacterium]|nr:hypothetical protein [Pseudonocardiales bacterium]
MRTLPLPIVVGGSDRLRLLEVPVQGRPARRGWCGRSQLWCGPSSTIRRPHLEFRWGNHGEPTTDPGAGRRRGLSPSALSGIPAALEAA